MRDLEKKRLYNIEYRKKNKAYIKELSKNYREENQEEIRSDAKMYRYENQEKIKAKAKIYRDKNRDKLNAKRRAKRLGIKWIDEDKLHTRMENRLRRLKIRNLIRKWKLKKS